jgi:hypothetical protein
LDSSSGINWTPFIVLWIVFGCIGWAIGAGKGKGGAGFALGFFLGPIGMLIAAMMTPTPEIEAQRLGDVARASAALHGAAVPGGAVAAPAVDRLAQLERLQVLRGQGALSEEEFAREKERVLGEGGGGSMLVQGHLDSSSGPNLTGSTLRIQQLMDERGMNVPGAAVALGAVLRGGVDGVARIGHDGDQGVIAVSGSAAATWWSVRGAAESLDLRAVTAVRRDGRLITLQLREGEPITILAGSDKYARGWITRLQDLGVRAT